MQEWKIAYVNQREIPVLISDEKEALLAAKAAGRAIVGLWMPDQEMDEISAARYVVEKLEDATEEYLERVARRHMGFPWRICETKRLVIREMFADDFDEIWMNRIGLGFGSVEELQAYTKNQYQFYEFGFWTLVDKSSRELVGVAGLKVPEENWNEDSNVLTLYRDRNGEQDRSAGAFEIEEEMLELGYHVFGHYRRQGYAEEACRAILKYGTEELGVSRFVVRIDKENIASRNLAERLGFYAGN